MNADDWVSAERFAAHMSERDRHRRHFQEGVERLIGLVRVVLHAEVFNDRRVVFREQIAQAQEPGRGWRLDATVSDLTQALVIGLERAVYAHTAAVISPEIDTWEIDVPWEAEVAFSVPNGWWRRLWRLPERVLFQTARGTVAASGRVEAQAAQKFRFPDLPEEYYPETFGRPIEAVTWHPHPTLDRRTTRLAIPGVTEAWR